MLIKGLLLTLWWRLGHLAHLHWSDSTQRVKWAVMYLCA